MPFSGLLHTPRGSAAAPPSPGRLRLHSWLLACLCLWGPDPTVGDVGGPESGQQPLTLLIGFAPFCSVFGCPAAQGVGPGDLPGVLPRQLPLPPGARAQLASLRLAPRADCSFWLLQSRARQVLVASYSHPNHPWHRVGVLYTFVVVN